MEKVETKILYKILPEKRRVGIMIWMWEDLILCLSGARHVK